MMVRHEERITTSQTAVIITNFLLGTGILTLPRTSVDEVGTPDVWITLILGGLVALLAAVIMVKLNHQYPDKTFYEYSQDIIGKWIGSLISLFFVSYLLAHSGFQVRSMLEIIRFFLLEGTPRWAIVMIFLWVGLYLIVGGLSSIARLFQIVLPITFILFLLVVFMGIGIFDVDNLRPVLGEGIGPVLKGIKVTALSFSGIEIILILMPFMNQPRKANRSRIALIEVCKRALVSGDPPHRRLHFVFLCPSRSSHLRLNRRCGYSEVWRTFTRLPKLIER